MQSSVSHDSHKTHLHIKASDQRKAGSEGRHHCTWLGLSCVPPYSVVASLQVTDHFQIQRNTWKTSSHAVMSTFCLWCYLISDYIMKTSQAILPISAYRSSNSHECSTFQSVDLQTAVMIFARTGNWRPRNEANCVLTQDRSSQVQFGFIRFRWWLTVMPTFCHHGYSPCPLKVLVQHEYYVENDIHFEQSNRTPRCS